MQFFFSETTGKQNENFLEYYKTWMQKLRNFIKPPRFNPHSTRYAR